MAIRESPLSITLSLSLSPNTSTHAYLLKDTFGYVNEQGRGVVLHVLHSIQH